MKKQIIRIFLLLFIISIILIAPTKTVFASLVNTSASLEGFSIFSELSGLITGLNWTATTTTSASNSLGETGFLPDGEPGWTSWMVATSNSGSQSTSIAGQSLSTTSYTNLVTTGWSNSSASVVLTGSFTAATTGWVMIMLPYSISLDLTASDDPAAFAYGKVRTSISLAQLDGSVSTDSIELFSTIYGGDTYSDSRYGDNYKLGVMKWFVAGETGTFRAEVFTEANASNPVPLPGAIWLFAPALACFIGLRRKYCS